MNSKDIIITIDGYSACGKSTLAKSLAVLLKYTYVDSGAMYRAVTYYFLKNAVDHSDEKAVKESLSKIQISFQKGRTGQSTVLNGENVDSLIRTMDVSNKVSEIAKISSIRAFLVQQQREFGQNKGIVMDGRDIGTVVFPEAKLKIFLHAEESIRANRRLLELRQKGSDVSYRDVLANLKKRDLIDSTRADSPLKAAPDSVKFDNSNLSIDEQLDMIYALAKRRIA